MMDVNRALHDVFGHESFRGRQEEVINRIMGGGDAVALFPTGEGKSLCYQLPSLCRPGMGLVISPLIALMRDQVDDLRKKGVRADFFNSTLGKTEALRILGDMEAGEIDILYVTPERITLKDFQKRLDRTSLSLIAIDEAHCVSQWGHDFRPEYAELGFLEKRFPGVPRVALTATADPQTRIDMLKLLGMEDAPVYATGFDRPNISYEIQKKKDADTQLASFLEERKGQAGIVYALSRRKVDATAKKLEKLGFKALPYHAGMEAADRDENQRAFLNGDVDILVATTAFGMGVDKQDIRFVAHIDWPTSIEAYFQETGRAGRDGQPADAWMIYGLDDLARRRQMIEKTRQVVAKRVQHDKLSSLVGVVETPGCRRRALLSHFGQAMGADCGNCDNCKNPVPVKTETDLAHKILETAQEGNLTIHNLAQEVSGSVTLPEVHSAIRQMVSLGFLLVDHPDKATVKVTKKGENIVANDEPVFLRQDPIITASAAPKAIKPRKINTAEKPKGPKPVLTNDEELLLALRRLRSKFARKARVKAYRIFPDATLAEMVKERPKNRVDFVGISGVGAIKLDRYGEDFMEVIRLHDPHDWDNLDLSDDLESLDLIQEV